jgi:hypothetical protein
MPTKGLYLRLIFAEQPSPWTHPAYRLHTVSLSLLLLLLLLLLLSLLLLQLLKHLLNPILHHWLSVTRFLEQQLALGSPLLGFSSQLGTPLFKQPLPLLLLLLLGRLPP